MRNLLFLTTFFMLQLTAVSAQEVWKERWSTPVDDESTWDVDQAGITYLYYKQSLNKLDTAGKRMLTQSTKSLGAIKKIDATNWLKIALFSEEQQQICYTDNALAVQDCINLTDLGVTLAQNFSTSVQTDRIWVYDQLNSELQLITLRSNQRQIVQNLRSLIDIGSVSQLFEFQNILYIVDEFGQVATFDNFGTLINSVTLVPATYVQPFAKGLLYTEGTIISATSTDETEKALFFQQPDKAPIQQFYFTGKRLFVSTATTFSCYELVH